VTPGRCPAVATHAAPNYYRTPPRGQSHRTAYACAAHAWDLEQAGVELVALEVRR
jgi:hypothetical protein